MQLREALDGLFGGREGGREDRKIILLWSSDAAPARICSVRL